MSALAAPRATIVVPTFNEAENLRSLVLRTMDTFPDAEILIVDDASTDGTATCARELGRQYPIRVIERQGERGLATAVLRGLEESRTDICIVMDADLSHPPESIPQLVRAVEQGAAIAVGSRYVTGGDIDEWSFWRRLTSKAGTLFARPLTRVRDPLAGFFCLRRRLLAGVELEPRGFKILLEILARTGTKNIVEVPIRFGDRGAGRSKFTGLERKEFLRQVWTLYRELNAWPWRAIKFLATGASGFALHLTILCAAVEIFKLSPFIGAILGFSCAMTSNYILNRLWTFRARGIPIFSSYVAYAVGALGGLWVQLYLMKVLSPFHYTVGASIGIALGTLVTFLTSNLWAFAKR